MAGKYFKSGDSNWLQEWRKRKRSCVDVINSILENYPKSKKILLEDIGVETDEDAGVSPPQTKA